MQKKCKTRSKKQTTKKPKKDEANEDKRKRK